jgi:hypothetical protein
MMLRHRPSLLFLFLLLALSLVVAGCAPNANAALVSPGLGAQLYAEEANQVVQVEPTPVPRKFTELTPDEQLAGLPPDFAALLATADPSRATTPVLQYGCSGCHSPTDPTGAGLAGPTWVNVADTATNRVPGQSPALYIYTSIINPSAYLVADHPDVMPKDFSTRIPPQDLANIIAYLMTLHQ